MSGAAVNASADRITVPGNDRLQSLSDYPFTLLTQLLGGIAPRANTSPLNMAIGEPQADPPDLMIRSLADAPAADWGRYPPGAGTPDLRDAIRNWLTRRFDLPPSLTTVEGCILPVSGTREALFQLALLAVPTQKAGERPVVLIPNPFYAVYEGAAILAGAEPVFMPSFAETGFLPDLSALPATTLARTALMYLCTPANPAGVMADRAWLKHALELARRYGFILAVDECYTEIWDRHPPDSALQAVAERSGSLDGSNLVVFHSLSKRSSAAGLRSGFCVGDPAVMQAFARLRSYGMAGVPLPVQAASAALWRDDAHVTLNRQQYRSRIDAAETHLAGRLGFYRPPGGFFLWLDVGDGEAAACELWREAAIRTLPGAFLSRPDAAGVNRGHRYLRVALVHDLETVARATRRIAEILT